MFKATEKTFIKMLTSGTVVEVYVYCEPNFVYFWKGIDKKTGISENCYLICPKTADKYNEFIETLKRECPLLMELV